MFFFLIPFATGVYAQERYREATIAGDEAVVYSTPTTLTSRVTLLDGGTLVQVYKKSGRRYLVRFRQGLKKRQGWVREIDLAFGDVGREDVRVKVFPARITAERVAAYEKPSTRSRIVGEFTKDQEIEIVAQTQNWLKILVVHDGPIKKYGFIRKGTATLTRKKPVLSTGQEEKQSRAPRPRPQRKRNVREVQSASGADWQGHFWSVEFAPLFNLKRYGATQFRTGVLYEMVPHQNWQFGFPFRYTFGGGFNTMQFGGEVSYLFFSAEELLLGLKVAPTLEYLFGSGRSFWAFLGSVGPTLKVPLGKHFWFGMDPFVLDYAVYRSKSIPSFMRWQTIIRLGGRF